MPNIINWFEIPVVDMDRAIAFYEPVIPVALRRESMDVAELRCYFPTPGSGHRRGAL